MILNQKNSISYCLVIIVKFPKSDSEQSRVSIGVDRLDFRPTKDLIVVRINRSCDTVVDFSAVEESFRFDEIVTCRNTSLIDTAEGLEIR